MNRAKSTCFRSAIWVLCLFLFLPALSYGSQKFQFELFGGISYINPKDFNLFSRAEEQYNNIYFIEHVRSYGGYFVNDFPEIAFPIPAGFRFKYLLSESVSISLGLEGFSQNRDYSVAGTFSWAPSWHETHSKEYAPYSIGLSGYSIMGGFQYRFPVGNFTEIELGGSAGWTFSRLKFSSTWFYTIDYFWDESYNFYNVDGGTLEGDGSGNGFSAQGMLRINRNIGQHFGFFAETDYTYCRIKTISGTGRETRLGIPGDNKWEGKWGIKKEEIKVGWGDASILVPTNYWDNYTTNQYERDFVLDLSGVRLVVGFFVKL
ncbi:hypothetical protein ACFLRX_02365 [Acidobacteriota bacterium]